MMVGNGNGGIVHPEMMRADQNILRAIQYLSDLSPTLAGISIVVVTKDGNAATIQSMSPDPRIMNLAVGQMFGAMRKLSEEVDRMSEATPDKAPTVGQIIRPPPIMGG